MSDKRRPPGFDGAAAVTRSLLGYGVVAGVFYLVVGVVLGMTREGFDFGRHPLSLLMLGDDGWLQKGNLLLTGAMTIAAGIGIRRVDPHARLRRAGTLVAVYGAALMVSGLFPPDPMAGFPSDAPSGEASASGLVHLAAGGIGFLALAAAAFTAAAWFTGIRPPVARRSRLAGAVIVLGFVAGAALATQVAGVVALWVAVVTGWLWLGMASIALYREVPHPDPEKRIPAA